MNYLMKIEYNVDVYPHFNSSSSSREYVRYYESTYSIEELKNIKLFEKILMVFGNKGMVQKK